MSENISFTITPPNSPAPEEVDDEEKYKGVANVGFNWFCCLGEAKVNKISVHESSYINRIENLIFPTSDVYKQFSYNRRKSKIILFGHAFDMGSALLCNCKFLFKLMRCELMALESAAKLNIRILGSAVGSHNSDRDFTQARRNCIEFLMYIREYILCSFTQLEYKWILKKLLPALVENLSQLRLLLRHISSLPDYICLHAANTNGVKCTHPAYHLFHCHLDLRWLHLVLLATIADVSNELQPTASQLSSAHSQVSALNQKKSVNFNTVEHFTSLLVSDLIQLAIMRFEKCPSSDLVSTSAFVCTCIAELWILVNFFVRTLESRGKSKAIWDYVNTVVEDIVNKSEDNATGTNCATLHRPRSYSCSNPHVFSLWLIRNLAYLFCDYQHLVIDKSSNFSLLEIVLKGILSKEVSETQLRIVLSLLSDILIVFWEPRTEPVILLWEYFQKRLNAPFYLPGMSLQNMEVLSKSALGLISQARSRLETDKTNNFNSFEIFIRILGLHLQQTKAAPRHWKQMRGRIYSKISTSKLVGLTELGMYHFLSLFLTLAVSADVVEVSKKLQEYLIMIAETELRLGMRQLIWHSQLACCLLLVEQGFDFRSCIAPVMKAVETEVSNIKSEHALPLLRTFVEAFQDIIDCSSNFALGQSLFIGNWISQYLLSCPAADALRLLDVLLTVINRLQTLPQGQISAEIQDPLWEHLLPYLQIKSCDETSPYQVADLAFGLSVLPVRVSNSDHFKDMFSSFVISEHVDVRLMRRFLYHAIQIQHLPQVIVNYDRLIFKAWVRCMVLSIDCQHTELKELTKYVARLSCVRQLSSRIHIDPNSCDDPLTQLFSALKVEYESHEDIMEKSRLREKLAYYLDGIDRWLKSGIKVSRPVENIVHIYRVIGEMVRLIPHLLYFKSKPNSILKNLLDLLLLPLAVHNPEYKLHPHTVTAVHVTLNLYIEGLIQLGPQYDPYISRALRELITLYLPRCVSLPGTLNSATLASFSLLQCFKDGSEIARFILEIVCSAFIKRKSKTPHMCCSQALKFISDVFSLNRHDACVVGVLIKFCMERVCDVIMFCEDNSYCKKQARDIVQSLLDCDVIRLADDAGTEFTLMLSRLCREYLAFSSRQLFELLYEMVSHGPDLIARFLPTLVDHVKEVETKRGVGYDKSLRMCVDRLEMKLKKVKR